MYVGFSILDVFEALKYLKHCLLQQDVFLDAGVQILLHQNKAGPEDGGYVPISVGSLIP